MTIAELKARMAQLEGQRLHPHTAIMAWQKKFSIPAACLVFTLIALGLGVTNRRDGKLAAFVLGIGVVFIYYMLMYGSEALAQAEVFGGWFSWAAMWVPNVVVGVWGALLDHPPHGGARASVPVPAAAVHAQPSARHGCRRPASQPAAARRPARRRVTACAW